MQDTDTSAKDVFKECVQVGAVVHWRQGLVSVRTSRRAAITRSASASVSSGYIGSESTVAAAASVWGRAIGSRWL